MDRYLMFAWLLSRACRRADSRDFGWMRVVVRTSDNWMRRRLLAGIGLSDTEFRGLL